MKIIIIYIAFVPFSCIIVDVLVEGVHRVSSNLEEKYILQKYIRYNGGIFMAKDTNKALRNDVIYSVFVRNYSEEGTFQAVERDLDRIKSLGVDIIWLMPIQPSGKKNRKGSLGSPYAISDYRAVNPEFGTMEDFIRLVDAIHEKGMKCIIDVVYNHTSPDSVLSKEHPEWFFHKQDGSFGNRVGDWWDVIDLDYSDMGLWDYQIETLKMWAKYVDGFRCDVAPMIPFDFWIRARKEIAEIRPNAIWLAESIEPGFLVFNRSRGLASSSDSEMFQAFDICYDYDITDEFYGYLEGKNSLAEYADAINRQEAIYPDNYVKARFLENHDRLRAAFMIRDEQALRNWTAFEYFQKGCVLLYNGQETGCEHTPSLFDKDTIPFENSKNKDLDFSKFFAKLYEIKKNQIFTNSSYQVFPIKSDTLLAVHIENCDIFAKEEPAKMVGIFSFKGEKGLIEVGSKNIPDGRYKNLLTGDCVEVNMGHLCTDGEPIVFECR